ncbi:hypothetical protein N0V88_002477 [Collariella sp. IMI 366227]|nr:hypothetical protein N0V88_002477 [Collariella sp. IMI 366227]
MRHPRQTRRVQRPCPGQPGAELRRSETDPWSPALVNVGGGMRCWKRGIGMGIGSCGIVRRWWEDLGEVFAGRGRNLGRAHCDASYSEDAGPDRTVRTLFTVHVYLNDSKAEVEDAELVGGATTFYSNDEKRRMDVDPKAGRVLIFQHRRLNHSGDDVLAGTKYTMRTDILYEFIQE